MPRVNQKPRVCILITSFGDGGVERMLVNTARGMAALGADVDFIVNHADKPYLDAIKGRVNVIQIGNGGPRRLRARLLEYLDARQPRAVLTAKRADDNIAMRAKALASSEIRFVTRPGGTISAQLRERGASPLRRWLRIRQVRKLYRQADRIVAVSQGVADDVSRLSGIARQQIEVIRNPNITPDLEELSQSPLSHPWYATGQPPIIIGMGGLRKQKDFPTLIQAFARLRAKREARLLILGQGRQHGRLRQLAMELGISEDVDLPGFVSNPYPYLKQAQLFVLSSLSEGSPNVLTEALALGTPVVATDCQSGPREILQDGRYGPLVSIRDADGLAKAMGSVLDNPLDSRTLRDATTEFTMEKSARRYLEVMGVKPENM